MNKPNLDREKYVIGDISDHLGFLHCEELSERSHIHGWTVEPHFHEGLIQLFVFGSGLVKSQIDTVQHNIQGPALIWMPAMVTHAFEYPTNMPGWVITVPSADVARLSREVPWTEHWINTPQLMSGKKIDAYARLCVTLSKLASEEVRAMNGTSNVALESIFRLLLTNYHRAFDALETHGALSSDRRLDIVTRFRSLLDHHLDAPKSVSEYAELLAVTSTHLSRTTKSITGRTAGELIADRITLEAKRRLIFTDLPVNEIGYTLNFSSPSYFTRFFTNEVGESPSSYRSRKRNMS
jgi:AraC family transcriptional activator of pobA